MGRERLRPELRIGGGGWVPPPESLGIILFAQHSLTEVGSTAGLEQHSHLVFSCKLAVADVCGNLGFHCTSCPTTCKTPNESVVIHLSSYFSCSNPRIDGHQRSSVWQNT